MTLQRLVLGCLCLALLVGVHAASPSVSQAQVSAATGDFEIPATPATESESAPAGEQSPPLEAVTPPISEPYDPSKVAAEARAATQAWGRLGLHAPAVDVTAHPLIPAGAETVTVQRSLNGQKLEPGRHPPLVVYPRYLGKQAETDGCPCPGKNSRILNIMTFNILRDLDDCPFPKQHCINALADIVLAYEVDVMAFQEVTRWLRSGWTILEQVVEIVNKTKPFEYTAIPFTTIITRLPVLYVDRWFEAGGSGALLEVAPGVNIAVYCAHVVAYPYGPYELRDHAQEGLAAIEKVYKQTVDLQLYDTKRILRRVRKLHQRPEVQAALSRQNGGASSIAKDNFPIAVLGDFNIPSHLDHTKAASRSSIYTAARLLRALPFPWPVSQYFEHWRYRDAYREFHPDPVRHPGVTWTSMPSIKEVYDRIDYIYLRDHSHAYKSSEPHVELRVVDARRHEPVVVTPSGQAGFFSDHRGVFSRVEVTWPSGSDPNASSSVRRSLRKFRNAALQGQQAADDLNLSTAGKQPAAPVAASKAAPAAAAAPTAAKSASAASTPSQEVQIGDVI